MIVVVLAVFVVLFLATVLGRTRLWWVPGALLMIGAVLAFGQIEDLHGDVGGIGAMANGVLGLAGTGLAGAGVIVFAINGTQRATRSKPANTAPSVPAPLPVATVVRQ